MREIMLNSLAALLLLVGMVGCVVPVIPGPIVAYSGMICLLWTAKPISVAFLVGFGVLTAIVTVLDYVIPAMGAKKFNCTKWGTFGCFVGTIVGVFFFPVGLLVGPFCGALIGELIAGRKLGSAAFGGLGALLGFLSGVAIKLALCVTMAGFYVWHLFK